MNTRLLCVSLALFGAVAVQVGGCLSMSRDADKPVVKQPDSRASVPSVPKNPDAKRGGAQAGAAYTGVLRSGIAGIGGEHTGWQLERAGGLSPIEVDVGKVAAAAAKLEGRSVTVGGTMMDKKYVERGVVKILRIETIAEAKSERY